VVANSLKRLQQLMDNLKKVIIQFSLKINVKKMNVKCTSPRGNNQMKI